ncbi:N-acetylglucosamine-6-phosphate deacetylase [Jannaschia sp. R86511]|uniref:N-acetylglucosamine-6-phosphate deacetylase n=1 Tax=Jannaschia sp. R86511 TaxID=3093853 RepID=UPI0036D21EE0
MTPDRPGPPPAAGPGPALVVRSVTAVDAAGTVPDAWLSSRDGRITATGTGDGWRAHAAGAEVVDGTGRLLVPGFVDLHVHGGGGHSHEDGPEAVLAATAAHARHGTTRTVVSLVSDTVVALCRRLGEVADLAREHPHVLGSHLEGPFLAPARKGAHDPQRLVDPTPEAVERLLAAARGTLRQVTLAPERPGATAAAEAFRAAGVVVAVGHTEADHALAAATFARGARLLTHAFNAMPGVHHRAPGPVVAAVDDGSVVLEVILDGEHVHPRVVAMLLAAAPDRVALVTDAMAAAAATDGDYVLGGLGVTVSGGRAVVTGTDTLAGSTLTMDRALRTGVAAGLPLPALVAAATATPARVLGLGGVVGRLAPGQLADLVLLDETLHVVSVHHSGLPVRG